MLILVREKTTEKAVQGCLFLNDTFICYTLENAAKAVPTGGYNIENSKSPKFKRELPLLYNKNVPAKRGIRIHTSATPWRRAPAASSLAWAETMSSRLRSHRCLNRSLPKR